MCKACKEVLEVYNEHYSGEIQGCCLVIADDIRKRIGGRLVAGYLLMNGNRRSHWWVEKDSVVHDPMGDEYKAEPGFNRVFVHAIQETFRELLPRYEKYRIDVPGGGG